MLVIYLIEKQQYLQILDNFYLLNWKNGMNDSG